MTDLFNPLTLAKAAIPLVKSIGAIAKLRDADHGRPVFAGVATEMGEALDILARDEAGAVKLVTDYAKGIIAGRPDSFDEATTLQWIRTATTQDLICQAVEATIAGEDAAAFAEDAANFYATYPEADGPGLGYAAFEYACAFVSLFIARKLDTGDRLVLAATDALSRKIDALAAPQPLEVIDDFVTREIDRLRRSRFYADKTVAPRATRLVERLISGDLAGTSAPLRLRAIAACARYVARTAEPEAVTGMIAAAAALGDTEDAAIAEAALIARNDRDAGLKRLAPIDTDAKRTAAFSIILNADGAAAALDWAETAQIGLTALDSDGRHLLLASRMQARDWDGAYAGAIALTENDFATSPVLLHSSALARIARHVVDDLRPVILTGIPLDPANFPIDDGEAAMADRRAAAAALRKASGIATALDQPRAARLSEAVALWLDLRDPETATSARVVLEAKLEDSDPILWIPLGLGFEVRLDLAAIERALGRLQALDPSGDVDVAFARLAIAQEQPDDAAVADYFERHRVIIAAHLEPNAVIESEVRILIGAGRVEQAEGRLTEARPRIDPANHDRLAAIIAKGGTGPTIAELEERFAREGSTPALAHLVAALSKQDYSDRLYEVASMLVERTGSRADLKSLVNLLAHHGRQAEIGAVLSKHEALVAGSHSLRAAAAWHAFRTGDIRRAAVEIAEMRRQRDDRNDRILHVNILITTGRWKDLNEHIEEEWRARDDRGVDELVPLARIAAELRSSRVPDLLRFIAAKAPDNADALVACYMLATSTGDEDAADARRWFEDAVRLSGSDGPVRSADVETLIAETPEWERRRDEIWGKLRRGELPTGLAAKLLQRPSLEIQLLPMLANARETDPRRRFVVPAFSGARQPFPRIKPERLSLGASTVVTLATLDLLNLVLTRWPVVIPHMTLGWLFTERQRLAFHQPSRIAAAHALSRALAAGRLHRFSASAPADEKLIDKVGRGLAAMLTSALERPEGEPQRIVVRSAPVRAIGSFKGEGLDLSRFAGQLVSCLAIVDVMAREGRLSVAEERFARAYLETQEERWPIETEIEIGADLYLDDLSVAYFTTVGMLDKIHAAGFRVFLSQQDIDDANQLIEAETRAADIDLIIERIRAALAGGIETGRVLLDPIMTEEAFEAHPDLTLVRPGCVADAIVCDDRYLNRYPEIIYDDRKVPMWTTLDLLDELHAEGLFDEETLLAHRTTLRNAGLGFITPTAGEVTRLIASARLRGGNLLETQALRALRENLQLLQMRGWLALPGEGAWFEQLGSSLTDAIAAQWTGALPDDAARARSRWLLALLDRRGWSGQITETDSSAFATYGLATAITGLIFHRFDIADDQVARFDAWLLDEVIQPFRFADPKLYDWLIGHLRDVVRSFGGSGESAT